jgi:hypothetical protein
MVIIEQMNSLFYSNIKALNFSEYLKYVNELAKNGACSGEFSEDHKNATQVYSRRMKRIFIQTEITPLMKSTITTITKPLEWFVLTESWCGDGAYSLPLIARIAQLSGKIKLSILLRNENLEIMDAHLTNGTRSIPKLICVNALTKEEIGSWGPRPQIIQEKVKKIKTENPAISKKELWNYLHVWYSEDNGKALQNEFIVQINKWTK